jgi:hypothetical protein
MLDVRPIRRCPILALLVATAGLPSCGADAPETEASPLGPDTETSSPACLWQTDELLSRVGAPALELFDCGTIDELRPADADCFTNNLAAGRAVQISRNSCIDCFILFTYVATPNAEKFQLYREADSYGDGLRVVRVDACTDLIVSDVAGVRCTEPVVRYSCSDSLSNPSAL